MPLSQQQNPLLRPSSTLSTCMRLPTALFKQSASSSRWTARQSQDPYVRLRNAAKGEGEVYRSRSAFKLVSLSRKYPSLLGPGNLVVDLGAAPGGWSQVAASSIGSKGRVWAVDSLEMEEIPRVEVIKGDFLDPAIVQLLGDSVRNHALLQGVGGEREEVEERQKEEGAGLVDTVLSDMMAPMSGVRLKDVQASLDLVEAATGFAKRMLKTSAPSQASSSGQKTAQATGGSHVLKYFAHPDLDSFKRSELDPYFSRVVVEKPKESRKESSEAYWVCLGYRGNEWTVAMIMRLREGAWIPPIPLHHTSYGEGSAPSLVTDGMDDVFRNPIFNLTLIVILRLLEMGRDKHQCPVTDCRREYTDIRMLHLHAKNHGVFTTPQALKSQQGPAKVSRKHQLENPVRLKEKSKKDKKRRPRDDSPHPLTHTKHAHPARQLLKQLGPPEPPSPPTTPEVPKQRCTIDLRTPSLSPDSSSDDEGIEILTPPRTHTATAPPAIPSISSTTSIAAPTTPIKSPKGRPTWATRPLSPAPEDPTSRQPITPDTPPASVASPISLVGQVSSVPSPFAILSQKHFAHQITPGPIPCPRLGEGNAYDRFVTYALDDDPTTIPQPPDKAERCNQTVWDAQPPIPPIGDGGNEKNAEKVAEDDMEVDELDEDDPESPAANVAGEGDERGASNSLSSSLGSDTIDQSTTPPTISSTVTTDEKKAAGTTAAPPQDPTTPPKFRPDLASPRSKGEVSLLRAIGDLFYAAADLSASQVTKPTAAEMDATRVLKQVAHNFKHTRSFSEPA